MFSILNALLGAPKKDEMRYMNHLRDMLHNLPHHLFQNKQDAAILHDFFCCLPQGSANYWYEEVIRARGGKAGFVHFVGLPVGDGRVLSREDIMTLVDFRQTGGQLRQDHIDGKLSDKKFKQIRALLAEQFNQCLLKLVQAQFFKVCRPTAEMTSLPDYDPVDRYTKVGLFCRRGVNAKLLRLLSQALKSVPFHLNLPPMETHFLFLFFSILGRLEERAFIKKLVARHLDVDALSASYVGKYAGLANCDQITSADINDMRQGSGNALAKVAKGILFNNYKCYQHRNVQFQEA